MMMMMIRMMHEDDEEDGQVNDDVEVVLLKASLQAPSGLRVANTIEN